MKRTVAFGKTLLVDGPASASLLSGEVAVLGAQFEIGSKMVIREGKRVPFEVNATAEFSLFLGEKARLEEIEGNTIPNSWKNAVNTILEHKEEHVTVMVVGGIDVGKTSFCTYLTNIALKKQRKVSLIDADLGQSDLGPPSSIGYCSMPKPARDPFEMGAESVYFFGVTSPSGAVVRIVKGITKMKDKAFQSGIDLLVINTDGWIEGDEAVQYKIALVKQIKPDIVVGIQEQNELASLLNALSETPNITIERSTAVRKRDHEERKLLRERGYKKHLKDASMESFHPNRIQISDLPFGTGSTTSNECLDKIVKLLNIIPIYCEETPRCIFIVLNKDHRPDKEVAANLKDALNKKVKVVFEGDEEGLLVGLHDEEENFLGLGILQEIDYERMIFKVYTRIKRDVALIRIGQIKLDTTGKELGQNEMLANYV